MIKNLTLSVEDSLVNRARARAAREKRTLNAAFREWISRYAGVDRNYDQYKHLMKRFSYAKPKQDFTRGEEQE